MAMFFRFSFSEEEKREVLSKFLISKLFSHMGSSKKRKAAQTRLTLVYTNTTVISSAHCSNVQCLKTCPFLIANLNGYHILLVHERKKPQNCSK